MYNSKTYLLHPKSTLDHFIVCLKLSSVLLQVDFKIHTNSAFKNCLTLFQVSKSLFENCALICLELCVLFKASNYLYFVLLVRRSIPISCIA